MGVIDGFADLELRRYAVRITNMLAEVISCAQLAQIKTLGRGLLVHSTEQSVVAKTSLI
jgi:hypothetical protein